LFPFHIEEVLDDDLNTWERTDFWDKFSESDYDIILNSIFCSAEYPYHLFKTSVLEYINFGVSVNRTSNVIHTLLPSEWLREKWISNGGWTSSSSVLPVPVAEACSTSNLRSELNIPESAIVAGFHGRVSDYTYSEIPLAAFSRVSQSDAYFVLMGLSQKYRDQAKALGLKNVRFVDHSADPVRISSFLRTLDVFAHGRYDGETYGSIFAEALMHGLPCLSHSSSFDNAQRETMGPHGYFAHGLDDYAGKLVELFSDRRARQDLARGAVQFSRNKYSQEKTAEALLCLFGRLVHTLDGTKVVPRRRDSLCQRLRYRLFARG
jgi:glycosyltransferase involved in cell wall biosynthesis